MKKNEIKKMTKEQALKNIDIEEILSQKNSQSVRKFII